MIILDLRLNNFLEIFEFLEFKEVIKLSFVSKSFKNVIEKSDNYLQSRFFSDKGSHRNQDFLHWKIVTRSMTEDCEEEKVTHFPFFTNGGTYYNYLEYFFHKLVQDKGFFCTSEKENIIIKYCYATDDALELYKDIEKHRIPDTNSYYYKEIEDICKENYRFYPSISRIYFTIPTGGFTCPLKTFMVFASFDECEDLTVIESFYFVNNAEQILERVKNSKRENFEKFEAVSFDCKNENIYPLVWINVTDVARYSIERSWHKLQYCFKEAVIARFIYILLIDAVRYSHNSIDTGEIKGLGKIVRLIQ